MNLDELKTLQAPIKDRYKVSPEASLVRLRAEANGVEGIACKIDTHKGLVEAGLHPATGGDGLQACSGDMLLEALAACAGVTLQAVTTAFGVNLSRSKVIAEGTLDFRGTLGISKVAPVGFKDISLRFDIAGDVSEETMAKIIQTTEKYCVVLQTLRAPPEVHTPVSTV